MVEIKLQENILQNACAAFARLTGMAVETVGDHEIVIRADREREIRLAPKVKALLAKADALLPLIRTGQPEQFVLVTRQITVEMAERLRGNGIQFMDEAGNAYISHPPVYIFIKGNKNPEAVKAPVVGRAFKQTGLKVLYVLLCNPGMEGEPYRTIAAKTGVALGMVNWIMRELKELGFLLEMGEGRGRRVRLIEKEKLLERWVTAYAEQLRPKLLLGRYRGTAGWWQDAALMPGLALWGGEVAAAKLTGYLKPEIVTIYVDRDDPAAVIIPHKLKKDPDGETELLCRFWQHDAVAPNHDMVHPLLVYADLVATGNQRNLETARMIHEKHIIQLVREA